MRYNGGPAFPRPASEDTSRGSQKDGDTTEDAQPGMSLRDWFAGKALASLAPHSITAVETAEDCYRLADAMLAERKKTQAAKCAE